MQSKYKHKKNDNLTVVFRDHIYAFGDVSPKICKTKTGKFYEKLDIVRLNTS